MSWLSDLFGGGGDGPGEAQWALYNAEVKRLQDQFYAQEAAKEQERLRLVDEANRKAASGAAAASPGAPAAPVFPPGFESSYIPSTLTDPFEESALQTGRTKASDFIGNMVRRGTLTESGRQSAMDILGGQEAGVRSRLNDIGNVLLENEKAKLRGLAAGGAQPSDIATESSAFQAGLPGAYQGALPAGDLFDVSTIGTQAGGVAGAQTSPQLDPYAAEGGQLKTGLEEQGAARPAAKKRTTAVF
jgi:hypothetical protein